MSTHEIKRLKTSKLALYGSAGLADTFLSFGVTTLVMPIYNIGLGVDAVLLGWALAVPRVIDAITDPLMGTISDNTRSRFGRRRQYIFAGALLCALLFPLIWMAPAGSENTILTYFVIAMCLHSVFYTIFNVPYTALGYELSSDYDERTRIFAWRFYFATAAGVTIQWLYKLVLMSGETEAEGIKVVSYVIAAIVLLVGIIPAIFSREENVVVEQKKTNLIKSLGYLIKNKAFLTLMSSYLIIVTTLFSCGALTLYINIYYIFNGDKDTAATLSGVAGTAMIAAAFIGMLVIKKVSEKTGKKRAMIIALVTALFGTGVSWFTLTPAMPYLQLVSGVILGMGVQSCWLLISSLIGDVIDDDELRSGLRQEGIYSSASGFVCKLALALTAVFSGYVLQLSGFDASAETTSPEVGYRMKVIFVSLQAIGLLTALGLMFMFPITRQKAEETRRILDQRKKDSQEVNDQVNEGAVNEA